MNKACKGQLQPEVPNYSSADHKEMPYGYWSLTGFLAPLRNDLLQVYYLVRRPGSGKNDSADFLLSHVSEQT